MSYLVDTNVFSESIKKAPNDRVLNWLTENEPKLYVSSITIGEIRRGIERLPEGTRRTQLQRWLHRVCDRMEGRVLNFNVSIAHTWGQLKARLEARGEVLPTLDSQLAATAIRHRLKMVTRNVRDFRRTGLTVFNPFDEAE